VVDDLKGLSAEFARDPDSLVFLRLGEALRMRGEIEAASRVAQTGLERYPDLPEARDLYARILVDGGQIGEARQVWWGILEIEPRHLGANKGLGYLWYGDGDLDRALEHLETALAADPTDQSVVQALRVVRMAAAEAEEMPPAPAIFEGLEGADHGLLLVDQRGRPLGGGLKTPQGTPVADEVAAYLGGVGDEAQRAARLLGLGDWQWLVTESEDGNLHLTRPTEGSLLLVVRDRSVPAGRLTYLAAKANEAARSWLEAQQL
jgi:tetratricopeptide (TPR) repeat protein